jgi:hypothetical protein
MARIANKKTVDNNAGLLNVIDIDKKKVESVTDFGTFAVVLLKDGAIYHNHIGLEVRCKRWVKDVLNSNVKDGVLYAWLSDLVSMKNATDGHEEEIYPGTDQTRAQMLEYIKFLTIANVEYPITAFADMDTAVDFSLKRWHRLVELVEKLDKASKQEVKEETSEDLKKDFEHGQNVIISEKVAKALSEQDETNNDDNGK